MPQSNAKSSTSAPSARILVLERDEGVRRLIVTTLERAGYEVLHGFGDAALSSYLDKGIAIHLVISELPIQAPPGLPVLVPKKPFGPVELLHEARVRCLPAESASVDSAP